MTTCENYGVYSHQQIRHEMYDGAGPSSQVVAMVGWHELARRLTAIRHYLDSAIGGMQASRQGPAADAAVGSMVPLGTWVDEAQRLANDIRDRIDHQISGFTTTRNSIPEVPPEPRGSGWQEFAVIDTFTTSDQEADEAFNAEQLQQARTAMMAYQTGTNERVGSVAQFAPPPTGMPDLTAPTGHQSGVGALPGGGDSGFPGATMSPAGVGSGAPGDLSGAPPAPTGSQGGGGTSGAEHPVSGRPAPAAPAPPGGGAPGIVVPGTATVGVPRGPRPGRASAGRGGPGSAGGVRGGQAAGGFGPWGRGGGTEVGGFGAERGAGPAGSPDSPAARRPGVAGAGRAGGAGTTGEMAPFAGMGGSRGGEDNERQRPSYLIELDSNRLIGELPRTSPAVIGDEPPNDDEPSRQ
ncbi:MAG: PPE domain-containing protein [Pseudonocardiaceae bacterium]